MPHRLHIALLAVLLVLSAAPAAGAQAPSLTLDTNFAPPNGISDFDFRSGISADLPAATAIHGDRIYTVGETTGGEGTVNTGSDIGIVARRTNGTLDTGFSQDGKRTVAIAATNGRDFATSVAVLPDGRLRVLAGTDTDTGAGTNLDVAIVGLMPNGAPDPSWGGPTGLVTFSVGGNDVPTRLDVDPQGRVVVAGCYGPNVGTTTSCSSAAGAQDDTFIAVRKADGTPDASFSGDGFVVLNRAGGTAADRGIDVVFRQDGGVVALVSVDTDPAAAVENWAAVLRAFTASGQPDAGFAGSPDGDLVLSIADPGTTKGTIATALLAYGGRYWVTGSTFTELDTNAFLARVEGNGTGLVSRQFDMRGRFFPADQAVVSQGLDLAVVPGEPATLVVAGSVVSDSGTDWGAAAFQGFDGDLAVAPYGDVVIGAAGSNPLVGVAPGPSGWAFVTGRLTGSDADTGFGGAKLLVDADKRCNLTVDVPRPLEAVFENRRAVPITLQVGNTGTRPCSGEISVPAPYRLDRPGGSGPIATGSVAAGATFTATASLLYTGPRRATDLLPVTLTAPADPDATDNVASLPVRFRDCDLTLRKVGRAGWVPAEGTRRFEVTVRNEGTGPCLRTHLAVAAGGRVAGTQDRYTLAPSRSVSDRISVAVSRGGKLGARKTLRLRAVATADVEHGNDTLTLRPRLSAVGDSRIGSAGARRISGTAKRAPGPLDAHRRAVAAVDVAIVRTVGKRCLWLRSVGGEVRSRKAAKDGSCAGPVWLRASGARHWSLELRRALPPGSYEVRSRATIAAGFREGSFTAGDRNRIRFTVR